MTNIKFHAVNNLPLENIEQGSIYYTSKGQHYLGGADNSLLKISDLVITDNLPEIGLPEKLYIDNTSRDFYVWSENEFIKLTVMGEKGTDGLSAYELAVRNGFDGELVDYLESLKGKDGVDGEKGDKGDVGESGRNGLTTYELALANGFSGTLDDYLDSIKGDTGAKGDTGTTGAKGDVGETGEKGDTGERGDKGDTGDSFYISAVYNSLSELLADVNNQEVPEMAFVIISSDDPDNDADNGKVYIKDNGEYKYLLTMRGLRGEKGLRGDKGDTGARGIQGLQGLQGIQGVKGSSGRGIVLKGIVANESTLPTTGENGDAYWIGSRLYIWTDDLTLVAKAGFYRGNDLQGIQGIQGVRGEKGEKGETPILTDATTTTKGVVQVGNGLIVNSGVLSVNNQGVTFTTLPTNSPLSAYPNGVVTKNVVISIMDADYAYLTGILKTLVGTDLNANQSGGWLRMTSEVIKSGGYGYQTVKINSNVNGFMYPLFELFRSHGTEWQPWTCNVVDNIGKGAPSGVINGIYGMKYTDVLTNISYIKKGVVDTANSSNWEAINAPKEYSYSSGSTPTSWTLNATANTRITMTGGFTRGITFTGNTFRLKGGKVYKIDLAFGVTTTATSGVIRIGIFNATNNSAADGNKIAIGTGANDKGNKSSTVSIIKPTADTDYYVGIEANSPAGNFMNYSQNMTIVEI